MTYLIAYVATAIVFLGLDCLWLGLVARAWYRQWMGPLMRDRPNFSAAGLFYLLYLIGLVYFAVAPALAVGGGWPTAAFAGALFGLIAYGTYDMTNLATVKGWSVTMSAVDMAWGAFISSVAAVCGYAAVQMMGAA
ncbi:DUF2177 family protein [Neorhizobium lilium]|uniref:DUF2177 family protein n=1 Tax=Neorhizobium lilium TaxID=2503024 RepID=A0A3S3S781_9HYPH|nr:DUF2177 family protein [Neorhizobium lilium]RWX78551.1 DUF2177 family protein [Neorhizobium lilium]